MKVKYKGSHEVVSPISGMWIPQQVKELSDAVAKELLTNVLFEETEEPITEVK